MMKDLLYGFFLRQGFEHDTYSDFDVYSKPSSRFESGEISFFVKQESRSVMITIPDCNFCAGPIAETVTVNDLLGLVWNLIKFHAE